MIAVPREPVWTASELAKAGRVSMSVAWRIRSALERSGYIDDAGRLALVSELFAHWRSAVQRPQERVGAKWILPGRSPIERLYQNLSEQRAREDELSACLGLFAACDALGVRHVRGAPIHIYVRNLSPMFLERLGLMLAADHQKPDVIVQIAQWPESVFRAAVSPQGVPAADIIQCWLDVSHEPARGADLADLIWRRILEPSFISNEH